MKEDFKRVMLGEEPKAIKGFLIMWRPKDRKYSTASDDGVRSWIAHRKEYPTHNCLEAVIGRCLDKFDIFDDVEEFEAVFIPLSEIEEDESNEDDSR